MNKFLLIMIISLLVVACIGKHKSNAQKAIIGNEHINQSNVRTDTLKVDLSNSSIHWKGTKMRGTGKHEGRLLLQSAYILSGSDKIVGGQFIVDMTTIGVTDIPVHESVPIRNLNNHLMSEDFFEVSKYPTSKFTITGIEHMSNDSLSVSGNFTIKDITKNIEFIAVSKKKGLSTKFTFDRFEWNIAYEGNWADKTIVDKDVELTIILRMK